MSLFRSLKPPSFFRSCASYTRTTSPSSQTDQSKIPLHLLFQEAVGLSSITDIQSVPEIQGNEVTNKLSELELEIRQLKSNNKAEPMKPKSLYGVFTGKEIVKDVQIKRKRALGPVIFKELSSDMKMFVTHLYNEGYFTDANFFRSGHLDFSCFNDSYGRDFIKFAADKFGRDHQDIAKWLSGSDLKRVALFGCPSLARKPVFAAKRLRNYFEIPEDTVCSKCVLKSSCKFENQSVCKGNGKALDLAVLMRVIILYALDATQSELTLPKDLKASVNQLLKEIVKLSQHS